MADTLPVIDATTGANFIPPIILANRALEILRPRIRLARLVTSDSELASFRVGAKLQIPIPGLFSTNQKTPGDPVTIQTPQGGGFAEVELNHHPEVTFIVDDVAQALANQNYVDVYLESAADALARDVEAALWGVAMDFTHSVGTYGVDVSAATIRAARSSLNSRSVSEFDRSFVMGTKDSSALLGDSTLQQYFAYARPEVIAQGGLAQLYGFTLYESVLAPVNTLATPDEQDGFAFQRGAIMAAYRTLPTPPAGSGAVAAFVTDQESGIVLRVVSSYDTNVLGQKVTVDMLYGCAMIRDEKGVIVKS